MGPFRSLPKEDARVEKHDGSVVGPYNVTFTDSTIFIWDVTQRKRVYNDMPQRVLRTSTSDC